MGRDWWVLSAATNNDKTIKRRRHEQARYRMERDWWVLSGANNEEKLRLKRRRLTRSVVWWSQRDSNPCLSLERAEENEENPQDEPSEPSDES